MAGENACSSCGAGISGAAFVCPFCGASTGTFASTEAEELQMLRELAKAAQHIASRGAEDGERSRALKIGEELSRFWAVAPLPTRPGALRQAATEACSGITGKRDGNYDITNGQLALLSRAKTCVAILKTIPEQAPVVAVLNVLIAEKDRTLNPVWHKNPKIRFWLIIALVFGLLSIPTIVLMNKGQSESELREGIESLSGVYSSDMGTLQISEAAISVKGPWNDSRSIKIVLEGNQDLTSWSSWNGSTFSFKTRIKSSVMSSDEDCQGSLTKLERGVEVTVSGNTGACEGFNGTWSRRQ